MGQILSDPTFLARIKALQHEQQAQGEDPRVNALVAQAATIQQDMDAAAARCAALEQSLATLQSESEALLRQEAAPAMDTLLILVDRIESLHRATRDQTGTASALATYRDPTSAFAAIQAHAPLVNACKTQSQVVFHHFQSLHDKARDLTRRWNELATDFTFEVSSAQERIERVKNIVQVAGTLQNGIEAQRQSWQDQRATAEAHIQQARETIRSAERKRDSMESARVVRNILTFGIGEAFDFFDLNEEIDDAERTVANAEQNARACDASIQRAMSAILRINSELLRLGTLGLQVRGQEMMLQASVSRGQALRTHTIDLTNASLDVSLFVGTLAARSETFAVQHTAQEFARGVLHFGNLMASEGRLHRLLVERDPGALQATLDAIAQSDGENGGSENGRFIGTQQLAIEDMM